MVTAIPTDFRRLMPLIVCKNADKAIAFYKQVFGAESAESEELRDNAGNVLNAFINVGTAQFMVSDEMPTAPQPKQASEKTQIGLYLYMDDVDECLKKAAAAGAGGIEPAQDMFWGDRLGAFLDLDYNKWTIATHVRDVTPAEMEKTIASFGP